MKTFNGIFSIIFIALFIVSAGAQDDGAHHPDQGEAVQLDTSTGMGMMHGKMMKSKGMCGGMMKGGMMNMMGDKGMMIMHPFFHTIHHLSDMKDELNLTDKQIEQLKNISNEFQKRNADWKAAIEKKQIDLKLQFDNNASVKEVKKYFQAISETKLEIQISAYESAQKMLSVLNTKQKEKWQSTSAGEMCCSEMMHDKMGEKKKVK